MSCNKKEWDSFNTEIVRVKLVEERNRLFAENTKLEARIAKLRSALKLVADIYPGSCGQCDHMIDVASDALREDKESAATER